jgi:pimeloyl-ACP methyl ester carboxylesterase
MPVLNDIYYSISGSEYTTRPPIVLIHGAGSNHLSWPAEIRRLNGYRVLAIDLPGHGKSHEMGKQSIQSYADTVVNFLDGLQAHQAILIGHSMGGAIAMTIAINHPALVFGLGLIASGAHFSIPPGLIENLRNSASRSLAIEQLRKLIISPQASNILTNRIMQPLQEMRTGILIGDWVACSNFDLCHAVSQIRCPTWISVGSEDCLTPVAFSRFLAAEIGQNQLEIIPGAGHMVPLEKPEITSQKLSNFVEKLWPQ